MDLISRQAAIELCDWYQHEFCECDYAFGELANELHKLPPADVQPVRHGHWMLYEAQNRDDVDNGNYLYFCSNCNHGDVHAKTVEVPFCWFCGARMDGEQND